MNFKKLLFKDFILHICRQNYLDLTDFKVFKKDRSILVIKSASMDIFGMFIKKLHKENPNIFIYVITQSRDRNNVENLIGNNFEITEYIHEGSYKISEFDKEIEYLRGKKFDKVVVLYNNRYGIGFENVEKIAVLIKSQSIYSFNCDNELFKINNPLLRIKSLRLFTTICDWFWEYTSFIEKR